MTRFEELVVSIVYNTDQVPADKLEDLKELCRMEELV